LILLKCLGAGLNKKSPVLSEIPAAAAEFSGGRIGAARRYHAAMAAAAGEATTAGNATCGDCRRCPLYEELAAPLGADACEDEVSGETAPAAATAAAADDSGSAMESID